MSEFINTIDVHGDDAVADSLITRTITEFKDDVITVIPTHAFSYIHNLKRVDFPNVETMGVYVFYDCTNLESVNMPALKSINPSNTDGAVFGNCTNLTEFNAPNLEFVVREMFSGCTKLKQLNLPKVTLLHYLAFGNSSIEIADFRSVLNAYGNVFQNSRNLRIANLPLAEGTMPDLFSGCNALEYAILGNPTAISSNAFKNTTKATLILPNKTKVTPCADATVLSPLKEVYVPRASLADYKAGTNWVDCADKIFAIEDSETILSLLDEYGYDY